MSNHPHFRHAVIPFNIIALTLCSRTREKLALHDGTDAVRCAAAQWSLCPRSAGRVRGEPGVPALLSIATQAGLRDAGQSCLECKCLKGNPNQASDAAPRSICRPASRI